MSAGFEQMIHAAHVFFTELADNNQRAWFEQNKARYTEEIKKPAEFFAALIAEDLARQTGRTCRPKLFRIHRDVRFSKDKTPYNTHLHLLWSPVDGHALLPSWFLGYAPDYFTIGLGVMGLQGDGLARFRSFVDKDGDALQTRMDQAAKSAGARLSDWGPPPLKRVPKPYAQDHPHAELLKRKAFAFSADMPETWEESGLVKAVNTRLSQLMPVFDLLSDARA